MKHGKILLVALLVFAMSLFVGCTTVEVHTHDYTAWEITDDPTENELGMAKRECKTCGEVDEDFVPKLSDERWTVTIDEPTHTEVGTRTLTSEYGVYKFEIPKLTDHEFGAWTIVTDPTETAEGTAVRVCPCEATEETAVPKLSDAEAWTISVVNPDHFNTGKTIYTSETFGVVEVEIPVIEHSYGDWEMTTAPTKDAEGAAERYCDCEHVDTAIVPVITDSAVWSVEVTPADHFNTGVEVYTSIYGVVEVEIPVIEHVYGAWTITVEPTEDATGTAERVCDCTHVDTATVPSLSDSDVWTAVETPADHFNAGVMTYTSVYGVIEVEIPVIEHVYGAWTITVEPTMDTTGTAERECDCTHVDTATVPALSDSEAWTVSVVDADHFNAGKTIYTSEVYGVVEVEIPVIEHTYAWTITTEPTIDNEGLANGVCECLHEVEDVAVPALSDSEVWSVTEVPADYNNGGQKTYTSVYGEVVNATAKLVAPYDNKTYANVQYDAEDSKDESLYKNGTVSPWVYSSGVITLDGNGYGQGTAFPFRGFIDFDMVDASKGAVKMTTYDLITEDDGSYSPDYNDVVVINGFVDFVSGIIIIPHTSGVLFNNTMLLTPYGVGVGDGKPATTEASAWDNSLAINYTVVGGESYNIFIYKEQVHFGVSFVDMAGTAINAKACYNASYVKVLANDGSVIECFVNNGAKLVVADGYEGTYIGAMGEAVVSGYGELTVSGMTGTYEVINETTLGVYVNGEYYEVAISGSEYTAEKVMVEVTFDTEGKATVDAVSVNKNIACELPVPTNDDYMFRGWFYDAELTMSVEEEFIPTNNVTLYARWAEKVVVNLSGVMEGDATVVYMGAGDIIGEHLPVYGVNEATSKIFAGWYTIVEGEKIDISLEGEITTADSGITLYVNWIDYPAYCATYVGTELYYASNGNYSTKTLTIDAYGNISGWVTGIVESYDPVTKKITWKKKASDTTTYGFWFNEDLRILATHYSNYSEVGTDYYIFGQYQDGKIAAHYAVQTAKEEGSSVRGYYARLVNMKGPDGDTEVLVLRNEIISNFTATDLDGNALTAANLKNASSLIVRVDGEIIFAIKSLGASFSANSSTVDLDAYFGTYVNGEDTLVLDGAGSLTLNGVAGTYAIAPEGSAYGFDVYLADGTEYYELTLNGDSFTMVKPMVTVSFEEGEYVTIDDVTVNKNIAIELPHPTCETHMFNGWFYDAEFTSPVGTSLAPNGDVTIHALWKVKVVLTLVYNNGEEDGVFEYSLGDLTVVERPVRLDYAFVGWYTTEELADGTEWTAGEAIEESITVYAKWEVAPIYNRTYTSVEIDRTDANGGVSGKYARNAVIAIDPYGHAEKGSSWPFNSPMNVKNFNETTNYLEIELDNSSKDVYRGYIDPVSRIIILSDEKGTASDFNEIIFLTPFETKTATANFSSSYWNRGYARAIEYTFGGNVYRVFILDDVIYFGVTFEDLDGNAILGDDCYKAASLIVKDADGNVIGKFGYDGTTMQRMDGYEGAYTGEKAVTVNGVRVITIDGVEGTYSLAAEGAAYTADAYVDGVYYEVTLNKADYTAVVVKPMVTVTYHTFDKADVPAESVNKNIAIVLPEPTNELYTFRAWYLDEACTEAVPADFIPTEDVDMYALWAEKITLTAVYGNGYETVVQAYSAGDTVVLENPPYTNGKKFTGWFKDEACTEAYTVGVINEVTVIYAGWRDAAPFEIAHTSSSESYNFKFDESLGAWVNGNTGVNSSKSSMTITALGDLTITFDYFASSENATKWDWLSIKKNGSQIYNAGGNISVVEYLSGTVTLAEGDTLEFVFAKDSTTSSGMDCAYIKNLTVNGEVVTEI